MFGTLAKMVGGSILDKGMGLIGGLMGKATAKKGLIGKIARKVEPYVMGAANKYLPGAVDKGMQMAQSEAEKLFGKIKTKWPGSEKFTQAMSVIGRLPYETQGNISVPSGAAVNEAYKQGTKEHYDQFLGKDEAMMPGVERQNNEAVGTRVANELRDSANMMSNY